MIDEQMVGLASKSALSVDELVDIKAKKIKDKSLDLALERIDAEAHPELFDGGAITQIKAFMVSQAKNELLRVIKLTDTLNSLEDTYMDRALDDAMNMDMQSLAMTMEVISRSLTRSLDLISKVTNDKNLSILIDQSMNLIDNSTTNNNTMNVLDSKESRDKIRNIASQLLSAVKSSSGSEVSEDGSN